MAKLRTWQNKQSDRPKQYRTSLGATDYDIPMFGYRSAFLMLSVTFGSLLLIPVICEALGFDYRFPLILLGGALSGYSVAVSQFFIERDKGFCKNFWIVGGLLSCFVAMLIFLVTYSGVLL